MRLWWVVLLVSGCRCEQPESEPITRIAHYAEWERLVDAAATGDLEKARIIAPDLTEGAAGDVRTPAGEDASGRIGGALAFVGFAEDAEELAAAVAAAAAGCGTCHGAVGALPPEPVAFSHESGARWAADGVAWNRVAEVPPGESEAVQRIRAAWAGPDPEARLEALLVACAGCHGPT